MRRQRDLPRLAKAPKGSAEILISGFGFRHRSSHPWIPFAPTPPDFDILVCAGDVWRADPVRGFRVLRRLAGEKPVVCVLGNHEHWNSVLGERLPEPAGAS